MPYQLCLVPADWPAEINKVTGAYAGRADVEIVKVSYKVSVLPYYRLPKKAAEAGTFRGIVIRGPLLKKLKDFRRFKTPWRREYIDRLSKVVGEARAKKMVGEKLLPSSGQSSIDASTFEKIRLIKAKREGCPSHVRWFGHGKKGSVVGADKTNVDLRDLAKLMVLTRAPILSLYCCLTGSQGTAQTGSYVRKDAPRYILEQFYKTKRYGLGLGVVFVNSNRTENMWSAVGRPKDMRFPGERHTYINDGGHVDDCKEGEAKTMRLFPSSGMSGPARIPVPRRTSANQTLAEILGSFRRAHYPEE